MTLTRRVKRLFGTGGPTGLYQCGNCEEGFDLNRQSCPRCGSYLVERSTYADLLADGSGDG